jgi:hypothetical protein
MASLFERALGDDWGRLHPRLRDRYGLVADDDRQAIGRGTMDRVDRPRRAWLPLRVLAADDAIVAGRGRNVPFRMTNTHFVDDRGHEALFLHREFEFESPRRFVDTLRWNPHRDSVVDLLGWHGRLAVEIDLAVTGSDGDGTLELTLGPGWLRHGDHFVRLPEALSVRGTLRDWYAQETDRLAVAAEVSNPLVGDVFGYRGQFETSTGALDAAEDRTIDRRHADTPLPGGGH